MIMLPQHSQQLRAKSHSTSLVPRPLRPAFVLGTRLPFNHKSMIEMTSKNCLQALIEPKMNKSKTIHVCSCVSSISNYNCYPVVL